MFYVIDLDVKQSRQANDSASIVSASKKDFVIAKCQRKRSKRPNKYAAIITHALSVIAAYLFGLLPHFLWHFAITKSFFGALTILELSLACLNCLTSKSIT